MTNERTATVPADVGTAAATAEAVNRAKRPASLALMSLVLAAALGGCDKGESPGHALDRGLTKTGEKVVEAGEAIKPK